jgi:hypothetical protein
MKIFHCDHCQQLVFFENTRCVQCGHELAFLPDVAVIGSLESAGENLWRSPARGAEGKVYRLCRNYSVENVCNWAVPAADPEPLCRSCRVTRVIPNLSQPGGREAWYRLEAAKRRLIYSLQGLGLAVASKTEDPQNGLAFEFLADAPGEAAVALTGHKEGVITLSVAEADDAEREKRRLQLHEPYRTLLGHFRHESGHYYWDRLLKNSPRIVDFRQHFGDEREDYGKALARHYEQAAPADWPTQFVSAYASMHAWEDWAETWAHYLHITDTLETAVGCGLSLQPRRADEPALSPDLALRGCRPEAFDPMIERWFALTYVLNNLTRGMGMPDAYPFVLSAPVIEKLRFIHETVAAAAPPQSNAIKRGAGRPVRAPQLA